MKWFFVLLYFLASILGWFYFCLDPIADPAASPLADILLSVAALLLLPIGLIPPFRFGVVLCVALVWAASAYFRHPLWSFGETLFTALLWLACLFAGLFSTLRPLETKKPLKSEVIPAARPTLGLAHLHLFMAAWFAGYGLTATAATPTHALYFISAWTLIMLFLCQSLFWPIPASYGWLGHDERKYLTLNGAPRLRQEILSWVYLVFLAIAVLACLTLPAYL